MRKARLAVWVVAAVLLMAYGTLYSISGIGVCDAQGWPTGCEDRHARVGNVIFFVGLALFVAWIVYVVRAVTKGRAC